MPELPEVTIYVEALQRQIGGMVLERVRIRSPSLLRTYEPGPSELEGQRVISVRRLGKRIVWTLQDEVFLVFHLMLTGRFRWRPRGAGVPGKLGHAAFDFPFGSIILTEAGTKKRASLHIIRGSEGLDVFERGGIEPLGIHGEAFRQALLRENRTLKRALTDQRILSGIGNAHSDEILHAACLSPVKRTHQLKVEEIERLYEVTQRTLTAWIERLRAEVADGFPERITAFHPAMRVHGKYGQPCPVCETPIQRIVYAENETNYCPTCQTEGRLLRDRSLSRVLRDDWPKTVEELEAQR